MQKGGEKIVMAKKNKKMLEIKEVTVTINLFIFSITIKFSKQKTGLRDSHPPPVTIITQKYEKRNKNRKSKNKFRNQKNNIKRKNISFNCDFCYRITDIYI